MHALRDQQPNILSRHREAVTCLSTCKILDLNKLSNIPLMAWFSDQDDVFVLKIKHFQLKNVKFNEMVFDRLFHTDFWHCQKYLFIIYSVTTI
jgi:hypothetical protein